MKNKRVLVTGGVDIIKSSSVKDPVRKMDISKRPCPVALLPSGRGELEITDVNNEYINQGRMGYRVLDGCLPRCKDVREFAAGWEYCAEVQGEK